MAIVPVIVRELRSQARQPLTYLLRLAGALAICLAFWLAFSSMMEGNRRMGMPRGAAVAQTAQQRAEYFGLALFGKMNATIFFSIWILTPLAMADSISRERREGTLPLLQLTALRPWEIVVGKSFVHMLRAAALFLTMAPWLVIPFLFGGISVRDLQMALALDASALFLAGAAGMVASTFSRDWLKSVLWAYVVALFLLLGMLSFYSGTLKEAFIKNSAPMAFGGWTPPSGYQVWMYYSGRSQGGMISGNLQMLAMVTNSSLETQNQWWMGGAAMTVQSKWQEIAGALKPAGRDAWFFGVVRLLAYSAAAFLGAVALAAWILRRTWRELPASETMLRAKKKYFTPKYAVATLRRRLNRALDRNPIGWLHAYSPSARLTKWSWCLFLILVELLFSTNINDLYTAQNGLGYLLVLGLLFSSAGSFRNELEAGAFELLLVTPIREHQILFGRVFGIWQQFFPAIVIHSAGALFLASGWSGEFRSMNAIHMTILFALLFLTAPFIGLYFSLRRWNFLVAFLCAAAAAFFVPLFVTRANPNLTLNDVIVCQLILAAIFAWRILARLKDRMTLSPQAQAA